MMIRLMLALPLIACGMVAPPTESQPDKTPPKATAPTPADAPQAEPAPPAVSAEAPAVPTPEEVNARAQQTLAQIPANAMVVVTLRDLAGINAKLGRLLKQLFIPFDPYRYVKGQLQLVAGIDDHGTAALVVLQPAPVEPGDSGPGRVTQIVLMVPTTDTAKLFAYVTPDRVSDRITRVMLGGKETYAGTKGHLTVFGATQAIVERVLDAKTSMLPKVADFHAQRVLANDFAVWIDAKAAAKQGQQSPMLSGMLGGLGLSSASLEQFECFSWALRLEAEGVRLSTVTDSGKPAKAEPSAKTSTLLTGLALEDYVIAGGGQWAQAPGATDAMARMAGMPIAHLVDPVAFEKLQSKVLSLSKGVAHVSWCFSALPATEHGMIGMTKVVTTTGSAKDMLTETQGVIEQIKGLDVSDEKIQKGLSRIAYRPAAEILDGTSVDHLFIDVAGADAVNEVKLKKAVGQEGLLFRMAAIGDKKVLVTFGGGPARFRRAMAVAKTDEAPLGTRGDIVEALKHVESTRFAELFLSVDRTIKLVRDMVRSTEESVQIPFMPPVGEPIVISASQPNARLSRVDAYVPNKVIVSLVNWGMQFAFSGAGM